ncbi:MAG: exopolyphosphatase / guanosine-5-triphosphate,3-diphosphate pyrophosphatase, partial [Sphingomonadales bacterium]|nr:exopolyphosphatase / guanosine-5-triphosphate,3-diphosphate pyrophosphatase [Sphingomonadales bacterium]
MFAEQPVAIIDIGSNSVRLVVYSAAKRIPSVIFNEKVLAGLGRDVGEIGEAAQQRALAALDRFRLLIKQMGVVRVQTVATAAVREASNGAAFLARVRRFGFAPRILSGEEEGRRAGQGVLSAIPDADGIVGDLGGGSLELVQVGKGKVGASASLPLGVLRLDALLDKGESSFRKKVAKAVAGAGFAGAAAGRPFYLVGGSWRTLARLEMALIEHPLPITHEYEMATGRPRELKAELARIDKADVRDIPSVSLSRFPTLPNANLLLEALAGALEPKRLIVSSFGIREGLLYDELPEPVRALDPLIEAAREAGAGLGRFEQHGDMLDAWIAPAFDDGQKMARLRLAACLLSDIAWAAHPDFRA